MSHITLKGPKMPRSLLYQYEDEHAWPLNLLAPVGSQEDIHLLRFFRYDTIFIIWLGLVVKDGCSHQIPVTQHVQYFIKTMGSILYNWISNNSSPVGSQSVLQLVRGCWDNVTFINYGWQIPVTQRVQYSMITTGAIMRHHYQTGLTDMGWNTWWHVRKPLILSCIGNKNPKTLYFRGLVTTKN